MSNYYRDSKTGQMRHKYTEENSFFYVEDSSEPLPFLTIAPNRIDSENSNKSEPIDHSDFLRNLGESIRIMRNNMHNFDNQEKTEDTQKAEIDEPIKVIVKKIRK